MANPSLEEKLIENHILELNEEMDELLVQKAAGMMREKLAIARKKGRGGWWDEEKCTVVDLADAMVFQACYGDPIDVMIFAAMIAYLDMEEKQTNGE